MYDVFKTIIDAAMNGEVEAIIILATLVFVVLIIAIISIAKTKARHSILGEVVHATSKYASEKNKIKQTLADNESIKLAGARIVKCEFCGKEQKFNTGTCAYCGGSLKQITTLKKESV